MEKFILVLDIGTTNIKSFLFNTEGKIEDQARRRPEYIIGEGGKVEQDPTQIWQLSKEVMDEVLEKKGLNAENIESIAISTYRASFLFWDEKTGKPLSNIITWQDKRCSEFAEKVSNSFKFKVIRGITRFLYALTRKEKMLTASMLRFNSDYASARTGYFLKENPKIKAETKGEQTNVLWGTIDSWVLWNLTEGRVHATDYSNASSTGLLDPFSLDWNSIVLNAFEIKTHILPQLRETRGNFGKTALFEGGEIPINCLIADQQASLFGQGCFEFGDMKVTNGTGSFVDLNTGNKPFASKRKLYPLIAWQVDGETTYMLEGLSHNTGNIIDWIQEELELFDDPAKTEEMAQSVDSTNGVYFLPTFTSGISFPIWDPTARGNLFGISLETKKEHIIRAVLEGICFRIKDIVEGIIQDTEIDVTRIKADGGVSENKFVLQFLSDILNLEVEHSENSETTALGAAFMAGLATGFWTSKEDLLDIRKVEKIYKPEIDEETRTKKYKCWKDIIDRSLDYRNV